MKRTLFSMVSLLLLTGIAQAHTHLLSSVPADKSRVAAPRVIELHFSEEARLTSLTLQQGTGAAKNLAPLPASAARDMSISVPSLAAGDYTVAWRVAGKDGHVMSGSFGFTIDPAAPPAGNSQAGATSPMHDHAGMHDHANQTEPSPAPADPHKH